MYVIPISTNIQCASSLESFLCHTYINEFSMCLFVSFLHPIYINKFHTCQKLENRSYVIPISTYFFMCLIFMSNLYQQISYMSHYHVYHTYIKEYSLCLLIRIISLSYLYQRIFHVSPLLIIMYVLFTSNLYQQISYMSETGKS